MPNFPLDPGLLAQPSGASPLVASPLGFLPLLLAIATLVVHAAFSAGVYADAQIVATRRPVLFANSIFWALAVLVAGLAGVLVYWLLHHSNLRTLPERRD